MTTWCCLATLSVTLSAASPVLAQQPPSSADVVDARRPRVISTVDPVYPAIARWARISGTVVVEATVAADGSVAQTKVIRSIPLLDPAAIDALSQWRFAPQPEEGNRAVTVVVRFRLDGRQPPIAARDPIWVAQSLPPDFAFVYRCVGWGEVRTIDTLNDTFTSGWASAAVPLRFAGAEKERVHRQLYLSGAYAEYRPPTDPKRWDDEEAVKPLLPARITSTADGIEVDVWEHAPVVSNDVEHRLDVRANGTWTRLTWWSSDRTKQGKQLGEVGRLIDRIAKQKDAVRRLPGRERSCS